MSAQKEKTKRLITYIEEMQCRGKYFFNKKEAIKALNVSLAAFNLSAHRLIKRDKLVRVKNGFYAVIPNEYRISGLPATFLIDALMKFLGQPYYVGVLSASALHGAAHQAPQELQVITTKPIRTLVVGKARIRFLNKKHIDGIVTQIMNTPMGVIRVSTPESTAIDLIRYAKYAGYLNNIATVLIELSEVIDKNKLVDAAKAEGQLAYAQRLGFLLDQFVGDKLTKALHAWLVKQNPSPVFLRMDRQGEVIYRNTKWQVIVNTKLEPDI